MNMASQLGSMEDDRVFAPKLLFLPFSRLILPSFAVRFAVALLLSFFPLGLIYPLTYPVRELITLCSWIWVFPSPASGFALVLTPLLLNESYGYFAFNLFCFIVTTGIATSAASSGKQNMETVSGLLYKTSRLCVFITIALCVLQVLSGPAIWSSLFPGMHLGDEAGRGAGLLSEPSMLAGPLLLYLTLLTSRIQLLRNLTPGSKPEKCILREGIIVILCLVFLSRSLSVAIAAAAFLPVLFLTRKNLVSSVFFAGIGLFVGAVTLGSRIREALIDAQGGLVAFVTVALSSWRNIPDYLILSNYPAFLWPTHPVDLRMKITSYAFELSPALSWIQNTYSIFAASASTVGLVGVVLIFLTGVAAGVRCTSRSAALRLSWMLLYVYDWFLSPKFDAAGWIALGLLPLAWQLAGERPLASTPN